MMTAMRREGIKKLQIKEKSGFELMLEERDQKRLPFTSYGFLPPPFAKWKFLINFPGVHKQEEKKRNLSGRRQVYHLTYGGHFL